jgi:hypothetical protein
MQRIAKSEFRSIEGVRLYLDDYYGLVEILTRHDVNGLKITADEYELDDPDDIKQLQRTVVRDLHLATVTYRSSVGRLSVGMDGSRARVHFSSAPDPDYGRALEILEFLNQRRFFWGRFSHLFFGAGLVLGLLLMAVMMLFSARIRLLPEIQKVFISVGVMLPFIIALGWMMWLSSDRKSRSGVALFLRERSHDGSFFKRHKEALEKLFIAVIAAAAGAVVKALFDK